MGRQEKVIYIHKDHPYYSMSSNGRISEARLLSAEELGRFLTNDEVVHHIDNNPLNNSKDNRQVMTYQQHLWLTRRDTIRVTFTKLELKRKQLEKELKAISRRLKEFGLE